MDKTVLEMLQNDVINMNLTYSQIAEYIRKQRSIGKFAGITNSEIYSYLESKMRTIRNDNASSNNSFDSMPTYNGGNNKTPNINNSIKEKTEDTQTENNKNNITNGTNNASHKSMNDAPSTKTNSTIETNLKLDGNTVKERNKQSVTDNHANTPSKTMVDNSTTNTNSLNKASNNTPKVSTTDSSFWEIPKENLVERTTNAFNNSTYGNVGINGTPSVTDDGRVQVELYAGDTAIKDGRNCFTVTTTPSNPDSLNRVIVIAAGTGGWNEAEVVGYDRGQIDQFLLNDSEANYTVMRVANSSTTEDVYAYVPYVLEDLNKEFGGNGNQQSFRYTFAGASASAASVVQGAKAVIEYNKATGSNAHNPMDFMLVDAAYNGSSFVTTLRSEPEVINEMARTGSIIYAYEAVNTGIKDGINELGKLTEDGLILVDVENECAVLHAYDTSTKASHEQQYSNGEMTKVVNGFSNIEEDGASVVSDRSGNSAENKYYLVLPKSEWDISKQQTYYAQRMEVTEKQLNAFCEYREIKGYQEESEKYLNDLIGYVESENKETGGYVNLASGASVSDDNILFDFQNIIDSANEVVEAVNNTKYKNSGFDYQFCQDSTADFPESLNMANAFLYGISNTLLGVTAMDTQNIEQVLNDFIYLDNKYSNKATAMMNNAYQNGNYFISSEVDVNQANVETANKAYIGMFQENISKGQAGKIAMSDIASMLSGSGLAGKIGENIQNEREDAMKLEAKINDMLSLGSNVVMGNVWEAEKVRLQMLSDACKYRVAAANTLEKAYVQALESVQKYYEDTQAMLAGSTTIDMGGVLDDGQIPVCEATVSRLQDEINALMAEYDECAAVPPTRGNGIFDEQGREGWEPNEPEYTNARNRMKAISSVEIPERNEEINYNMTYIRQLEGLAGVLNAANATVQGAIDQVNSEYGAFVNSIPEVHV